MKNIYKPLMGIMVYKGNDDYYLEKRKLVKTKSGDYRLGTGAPMKRTTLKRLLNVLVKRESTDLTFKGIIPSNVLHFEITNSGYKLTWLLKSTPQSLSFMKSLNIPNGVADMPNLIFKLSNKSISIAAVKTTNIKNNTILYRAPFHNLGSNGSLCQGTGKYHSKSIYFEDIMSNVEAGFFNSKFSHHNEANIAKCNINIMWKQLIENQTKFDNNVLIPMNKMFIEYIEK